jgi:succinoglycan biosynthesis transport protein ExoP
MELVSYIRLFRRWAWLIVIAMILAGGANYIRLVQRPTQYQARATILIGSYFVNPNPDQREISTGIDLAQTYAVLATNHSILKVAAEEGNLTLSAGQLASMITTRIMPETSLVEITVAHTDPDLAVVVADAVTRQLILNSPTNLTTEQQAQIDMANTEIARLQDQLNQTRLRLATVQTEMEKAQDPAEIDRLTEQYNTLIGQTNQTSANIANFSDTISRLQQRINSIDVIEPARLLGPVSKRIVTSTILAAMVGAALAVGGALLLEYLNDSLQTPEEVSNVLRCPMLAVIPKFGRKKDDYPDRLITYLKPDSPVCEEYRTLRTNLMHASNGNKVIYMVTSPGPAEGKTITVANLAVTMAAAGWHVLLIDGDLRRPKLHRVFKLSNKAGLSTLLSAPVDRMMGGDRLAALPSPFGECVQDTNVLGLQVITSGPLPLNPTEVLGSTPMGYWMQRFQTASDVDIMLVDSPPALLAADSAVLASTFHIPVILVIEAGGTRVGAAVRAAERLSALDIEIKGVVLNAARRRDQSYGYGYSYYYYYQQDASVTAGTNGGHADKASETL